MLKYILFLCVLIQTLYCKQIIGAEPILDYSNSNYMSQIHLKLSLQTPLTKQDYIKIIFPFAMHTDLTAAVNSEGGLSHPKKLYMTWNELQQIDGSQIYTDDQPGVLYTDSVDSANYFVKCFHTNFTQYSPEKDKFFIFKFNITEPEALKLQKSGELLQISAYSQSSVTSLATVYDQNPSFGYIFLENQPTELLDIDITYKEVNTRRDLDTVSEVYLDTTIKYPIEDFEDLMKLQFLLSDNSFIFTGECSSVAKTTLPTIAQLEEGEVESCSIDQNSNTVNIVIKKSAFQRQNIMRFKVFIKSPRNVVTNVSVINRLLYKYNPRILAQKISMGSISTNPIDVKKQDIKFGFGIQPEYDLPFPLKLIRGTEDNTYHPYNGIHVSFRLFKDTPDGQEQRINIFLKSEVDAYILPNSILENLPAAPGKIVTCAEVDSKIPQKRKISCTGVGKLLEASTYKISFRMFLPYDVSEPDINSRNFGSVTIEPSRKIEKWDNLFIIGRDKSLLQKYIQQPDITAVKSNIADYIEYLKSFDDVYLLSIAQDFPTYDAEIFPSFFTASDAQFGDVFIPEDHLNFIKYLKTFSDIWILQKNVRYTEDVLDYVKHHDRAELVLLSAPGNVLTIPTANGKNWSPASGNANSIVSSHVESPGDVTTIPGGNHFGLLEDSTKQILQFTTQIPFTDMTNFVTTASENYDASTGKNNAGMLFIMNPNIRIGDSAQNSNYLIGPGGNQASAEGTFSEISNDNNDYTYFKLSISNSDALRDIGYDPSGAASTKKWAIRSFLLNEYGSIYADDKLLDFYICMIDGIDGPKNLQSIISFVLINGFSMTSQISATLSPAVANYWTNTATPENLDGKYVPVFFKLIESGTTSIPAENKKISLFFDAGDGYYVNKYSSKISCASTEADNEGSCRLLPKSKFLDINSYQTMARFEIEITNPAQAFEILFPIELTAADLNINMYIGTFTDPIYPNKPYFQLNNVERIGTPFTYTTNTGTVEPFYGTGNSAASFGLLDCNSPGCKVGAVVENQKINFAITTTATAHQNAQLTYLADSNIFADDTTLSAWPHAQNSCLKLKYKYQTLNISQMRYGVTCGMSQSTLSGADPDHVILSKMQLPSYSGKNVLAYGALSDQNGNLVALQQNAVNIADSEAIATFEGVTVSPNMKQSVLTWLFTTPVDLTRDFFVKFKTVNLDLIFQLSDNTQCEVEYQEDGETTWNDAHLDCSPDIPTAYDKKTLEFSLKNLQKTLPKNSKIKIVNFGIDSGPTGQDDDINLTLYYPNTPVDQADDVIALSDTGSPKQIRFDSAIPASKLILSDFETNTLSKNAKSEFSIKFKIESKKLWKNEKILFDLGQYAFDNQFNVEDLECVILDENKQPSYDIFQLDLGVLSDLTITIRKYISEANPTYYLKCDRFFTPTTLSPRGISASLISTEGVTILTSVEVALPTFGENSPTIFQTTMEKQLATPGSNLILNFSAKSSKLHINSKSRIIITFPIYYSPKLSRDNSLACYHKGVKISCKVTSSRKLEITYFATDISVKEEILIEVIGVTQPQSYQVGTFFLAFDDDYNDSKYVEYGTFLDQGLSSIGSSKAGLLGTIDIRDFDIQSSYLRQDNVKYTFKMDYPSTYPIIKFSYIVMVNFPKIFEYVLQDLKPQCSIKKVGSDKNQVGICQIKGLRVQMHIKEEMTPGFQYQIQIANIRNPGHFTPTSYKWQIEITDTDMIKTFHKSIETSSNYEMAPFIKNPEQVYLKYTDAAGNPLSSLQLIKGVQSPKIYIAREREEEKVFARSFIMTPQIFTIKTSPHTVMVNVGTPSKYLQIHSEKGIGEYAFKLSKEGDGNYFSNLPVLFLTLDDRNLQTFELSQNTVRLYKNENIDEYLIFYDINCLPPINDLRVDFYVDPSSANLGMKVSEQWNKDKIDYHRPFGLIPLYVEYHHLNALGNIVKIDYRINGTNLASYELSENAYVNFEIVQEPTTENAATFAEISVAQNSKEIDIQCAHNGIFYYQVYLKNQGIQCKQDDAHFMNAGWRNATVNDVDKRCESQYGLMGIYQENHNYRVKLEDLKAETPYTFVGKCVSQTNKPSPYQELSFDTQANGGKLGKIRIDFRVEPSLEQETKVACFLALYFKSHPQLVTNGERNYCTQIHYSDSSQRRILTSPPDGLTCTDPNEIIQPGENQQFISKYYYFAPNAFTDSDDLKDRLVAATSLKCFKDFVQSHSDGVPKIVNVHTAELISETIPSLEGTPTLYTGYQWASIDDFKVQGTAKVFISLEKTQDSKEKPSHIQLRNGFNSENVKSLNSASYLLQSTVKEFNHTFTPLEIGQEYTVYYIIAQESPFDELLMGPVQELKFKTNDPPPLSSQILEYTFALVLVLALQMILFM